MRTILATLAISFALTLITATVFVFSGLHDVSATAPHWRITHWILETVGTAAAMRVRSIEAHAAGIAVPAPVIALLQDAMPRPGLPLVHFNDTRCGSIGELRSVIVEARRLAHDNAERERAAAAVKTWLLARIGRQRAAAAPQNDPLVPECLAA